MRALSIAATGMAAQQTNVEVIANNVANINTTGFKRARAEFTDLLYETERAAGTPATDDETVIPEGNTVGLGVRTAAIRNLHMQGTLARTGNKYDLALNGIGWFQVQGEANEIVYTRDGAFNKNQNGQLVTLDGKLVIPEITVPDTASDIIVNQAGQQLNINKFSADGKDFCLGRISPMPRPGAVVTGHDLKVRVADMGAFRRLLIEKLNTIQGVRQTRTLIVLATAKEGHRIKLD